MVAICEHSVDIFEIKSSYRPVKARKQLSKIRKIFGDDIEINTYFYHGAGAQLVKMN